MSVVFTLKDINQGFFFNISDSNEERRNDALNVVNFSI